MLQINRCFNYCIGSRSFPEQISHSGQKVILATAIVALAGVSFVFGLVYGTGLAILFTAMWLRSSKQKSNPSPPSVKALPAPIHDAPAHRSSQPQRPLLIPSCIVPTPVVELEEEGTGAAIKLLSGSSLIIRGTHEDLPMAEFYLKVFKSVTEFFKEMAEDSPKKNLEVCDFHLIFAGKWLSAKFTYGGYGLVQESTVHLKKCPEPHVRGIDILNKVNLSVRRACAGLPHNLTYFEIGHHIEEANLLIKEWTPSLEGGELRNNLYSLSLAKDLLAYFMNPKDECEGWNHISSVLMRSLDHDSSEYRAESRGDFLRIQTISKISGIISGYIYVEPIDDSRGILPVMVPETVAALTGIQFSRDLVLLISRYVTDRIP